MSHAVPDAVAGRRSAPESVPIVNETSERVVRTLVIALPVVALVVAGWLAWGGALHWQDLVVLAISYTLTGLGVTVGFHRLFTHRSFKTTRAVRVLLAVLGSTAVQGPVIEWVATHRKHHCFSDQPGDPHSPHTGHGTGWRGALRGLAHAHLGWMFRGKDMANPRRYAADLLADRDLHFISRAFPLWVVVGLALPFGLGIALTGSLAGGLTGLLWGGAVRIFLLHHATFSINSLCHFFGRRPFATGDESRNLAWLAPIAFGEAWHNNHHAFPTSARHGLGRWQLDPSAWLISALERTHLAWDVVRISPARQRTKRVAPPEPGGPRAFGRRHRMALTVVGSLVSTAVLAYVLAGRRDEFAAAITDVAALTLVVTVLLQIAALLARSEAWHLSIEAAGGTVARRVLYRASGMQVLGSVLNAQLGVAARIAALRRWSPSTCPQVPTLIAAEVPILAAEGTLAALASFTLIGPLGLPWWPPLIGVAVLVTASAGLRRLARRKGHELWKGLMVLRSLSGGGRVVGFVLVAVFAQVLRNWLLLHAVGVDASLLDSVALLIAVSVLGQIPIGPTSGTAAAVLILGSDGVAAVAAAGVLLTVTGIFGGLCFASWAGADHHLSARRRQ